MAEQLSPEAQAVLDAYRSSHLSLNNLAAALEELVDQVVPKEQVPPMLRSPELERLCQRQHTRSEILAIAAELEGK